MGTMSPPTRRSEGEDRRQVRRVRAWAMAEKRHEARREARDRARQAAGARWMTKRDEVMAELIARQGPVNSEMGQAAEEGADAACGIATPAQLRAWQLTVGARPAEPGDYWQREERERLAVVLAFAGTATRKVRAVVSVTVTALRPVRATRTTRRTTVRRVSSFAGGTSSGERDDGGGGEPPSSPLTLPAWLVERHPLAPVMVGGAA